MIVESTVFACQCVPMIIAHVCNLRVLVVVLLHGRVYGGGGGGRRSGSYVDSARRPPSSLVDALAVLRQYELAICMYLRR